MNDINEVYQLIENIKWLQSKMPEALSNWKKTKPNCQIYSSTIKDICESPGKINNIFDPLIKWLYDYILNREGKIAFTGKGGLDLFLKVGLNKITDFIVISEFFYKNPQYFYPTPDPSMYKKEYFEVVKNQKLISDIIKEMMSKLIGCNEKLSFLFLKLSKTIQELPDNLKRMQSYLENQCYFLKISSLKN